MSQNEHGFQKGLKGISFSIMSSNISKQVGIFPKKNIASESEDCLQFSHHIHIFKRGLGGKEEEEAV